MVFNIKLESGETKVAKLSGKRKEMKDQMLFEHSSAYARSWWQWYVCCDWVETRLYLCE